MYSYLEYVTLDTVLLRHPAMAATIRQFFADAGTNIVRAFYNYDEGLAGYVFHELEPKADPNAEDSGRYFEFVTTCEIVKETNANGESQMALPRKIYRDRIARQFSHNEWFTGPIRGYLDRARAVDIVELEGS